MKTFISPSFNLPLNWAVDFLFPVLAKVVQNLDEIIISDEDRDMLRSLKDERLLFFTNHPSTAEPPIVYRIGNIMGSRFKYMASRQVFDWNYGLVGNVISNLGAFSVIAGITDRESLKTARQIMAEPKGKLVLFPEGEPTSGENDSLMPFQPGVAQLGFWALEDARKQETAADITVLPGFIKYTINASPREVELDLHDAMRKLEKELGIDPGKRNLLRRFLHFGKVLLEEAENEYDISLGTEQDFDYRIGRVRHAILDNVAERLKPRKYDRKADAIVKLRQLFAVVEMLQINYPDPSLVRVSEEELEWAHRECVKAFDFIVIKRDYLLSNPTPERFYEWLARFESYVFQKTPRALGGEPSRIPRKAHISFAPHFKLSQYLPAPHNGKKPDKKDAQDRMLTRLRGDMQGLLDNAAKLTAPLFTPFELGDID